MNGNITTAPLGGNRNIKTKPLFQYDYGQVLKIVGVTLPAAYEVHFSNQLHGVATTQIGNADGVIIPDIYLTTGEHVYAWIYLHTGNSDGETEYTITIPVVRRASISDAEPTPVQQDVITQAIAALNTAVEQTAQDVQDATEAKQDAEEAAGNAYESAVTAGQYATTAGGHAADAAEASHNAEYQAGRAEQAHLDAQAAQWAAESAQTAAEAAQAGAVEARTGAETAQAGAVAARDEIRNMHATANTLPAGSQATASYSDGTLTLGIPKGDKGDQGQKGDTGDRGEQGEKGEKGDTGATGATPDFEIGTVQTLPAGSSATATITGTSDNPLLNLGIPKGDKGDQGEVTQAELSALSAGLTSDLDLVQTSGNIIEINDAFPAYAEDVTVEIVPVQSGSGDPSPENVRPISGFDSVKVTRTGVNVWDEETELGGINSADGAEYTSTNSIRAKNYIEVFPSTKYYFACPINVTRCWYDENFNYISTGYSGNVELISPANAKYFRFSLPSAYGATYNHDISLNYPSSDTVYESYNGIQVELPFGQTVYGGQIDLTTGKLKVTHLGYTFTGNEVWTKYVTGGKTTFNGGDRFPVGVDENGECLMSHYLYRKSAYISVQPDKTFSLFNAPLLSICDNSFADATAAEFAASMAGAQLVYPLATPQVYNLTPAQVLLLRDYNVLWANTGDIINLEYRAGSFVPKKAYDALKEATLIHSNASGAIASFADGAEMPVDEVTVQINPVQDLHGYDSPWPAGGGVNKIDVNQLVSYGTTYGLTTSFDGDWIVLSGEYTNTNQAANFRIATLRDTSVFPVTKFKAFPDSNTSSHISSAPFGLADGNKTLTIYISGMVQGETYNLRCKIVGYEGDTAPTEWSPYANICSITGHTGVNVTKTGKNLLDPTKKRYVQSNMYFYYDDGLLLNAGTYTLSYKGSETMSGIYAIQYPAGGSAIAFKYNTKSLTFTIQKQTRVIFNYYLAGGTALPDDATKYQLEVGSTDTDYEPYQGETYEVSFPSEAGTVYGGTLDVTNGVLKVDSVSVDLSTLSWQSMSNSRVTAQATGAKTPSSNSENVVLCAEKYNATAINNFLLSGNGIGINISGYFVCRTGTEEAPSGLAIYELATPITYTLTASQITTLLGENNLWHDANGDIAVGYKANTKLYIDGKIAELVAQIVNS